MKVESAATPKQISGENNAGRTTLETRALHLTVTPLTSAAPMIPPISAWLELDGSVKYHVIRFQQMAPASAPRTISRPVVPLSALTPWIITWPWTTAFAVLVLIVLIRPLAIFVATEIEMKAPTT